MGSVDHMIYLLMDGEVIDFGLAGMEERAGAVRKESGDWGSSLRLFFI